jgi:hypothetical protein
VQTLGDAEGQDNREERVRRDDPHAQAALGRGFMKHELKIWPQYFCRVADGSKTFEVRENDRGYQPGDEVTLREYDPKMVTQEDHLPMGIVDTWQEPKGYTGKKLDFKVGYVLPLEGSGKVVFSLLPFAV